MRRGGGVGGVDGGRVVVAGTSGRGAVVSLPTELHSDISRCCLLTKMAPNAPACEIPCLLVGEGRSRTALSPHHPTLTFAGTTPAPLPHALSSRSCVALRRCPGKIPAVVIWSG